MQLSSANLWQSTLGQPPIRYPAAEAQSDWDVAIVGGGFSGLWTAFFLKHYQPSWRICVLEARQVGHGASGRNGGWVMGSLEGLAQLLGPLPTQQRRAVTQQLRLLVPDFGRDVQSANIECDFSQGGAIMAAARYRQQARRARDLLQELRDLGFSEDDYRWLCPQELRQRIALAQQWGGLYTPHVGVVHPGKLIHGLASWLDDRGVALFEDSAALSITPGYITTARATLRARHIVIATEGYTQPNLPLAQQLLKVDSGMLATEPLSSDVWDEIGFHQREALADMSRLSTYLQRTGDDRLIVGARGSCSRRGEAKHHQEEWDAHFAFRKHLMQTLFPMLQNVTIEAAWGGTLAIARRRVPHLYVDSRTGLSTLGGYAGEGVGGSYLLGKTLALLLTGEDHELTTMPWVHRSSLKHLPSWPMQPLPWLGFTLISRWFRWEESAQLRADRHPSVLNTSLRAGLEWSADALERYVL
jgi:glycine/D-amino acid oxidase-like deaminating enzyme